MNYSVVAYACHWLPYVLLCCSSVALLPMLLLLLLLLLLLCPWMVSGSNASKLRRVGR